MTRYVRWMAILLILMLTISACSNSGGTQPGHDEDTHHTNKPGSSTEDAEHRDEESMPDSIDSSEQLNGTDTDRDGDVPSSHSDVVRMEQLHKEIIVGSTQEELFAWLGDTFTEVSSVMDGSAIWRFDFGADPLYDYKAPNDAPDLQGLREGAVTLQIFVMPDDSGNVLEYTAYEADSDGNIQVYYLFEDGSRKIDTINAGDDV